jgi:hypothetical protein
MKAINKILLILFLIISVSVLSAQTVVNSKGYQTDFEDLSEQEKWTLNTGTLGEDCVNKWYFGKPGANRGDVGLFVSNDGLANNYTKTGVAVVATRILTIDKGDYELSFEWQAGGMSLVDGLYVCWIPMKDSVKTNSVNTSMLQKWVSTYGLDFGRDSLRLNQKSWNAISDTIHSDGGEYKLVFVWNNGVAGTYPPAVCVDNILIMELGRCGKPTNLTATPKGDAVVLSWEGTADAYDVRCCNNMTGEWIEYNNITTKSQVISNLPEGICTYYVRSKCNGVSGAWVSIEKFLFYPGIRCIDYLNLSSTNCFYGTTDNPKSIRGVVDYGYQAIQSRHTIHWNPMERDPHTDGKLKTVPDGDIASVRLGNWGIGAEAEMIEYNYLVDTLTSAILLLNYAVVLQDPGHDSLAQPRFTLEILYENKPLDKFGCGEAFFSAGFNTDGWEPFDGGWWKDWTTIAINLGAYHGKSLKIRLTTLDCTASGHFGYAYFTLGCSDGKIKGLSCGDSPENIFQGPEGFYYRWYLPSEPEEILSTEQIYKVPSSDTLTYNLDVIQPTNSNCYYTLSASAVGRWPRANASYSQSVDECQNVVRFDNNSYVKRINQITLDSATTKEPCESYLWDFGDGTTSTEVNPKHIYPEEGGTYIVKLSAGIANDACMDDTTFTVVLPRIGTLRDTTHAVICRGDSYLFNGKHYFATGCYSDTLTSSYGCDSILSLDLYVAVPIDTVILDTICSDEEYYFEGQLITETGKYVVNYKSIYGCDSNVVLDIVVNPSLFIDFDSVAVACADDEELLVSYDITSGSLYSYDASIMLDGALYNELFDLQPEKDALVIPLPSGIEPGRYVLNLSFGESSCGTSSETLPLEIYYSNAILAQRWGDVLAVTNENYNGGYEFVAYQWFKNGVLIEGATSSILYVEEGLDLTARYSVLLTRKSDNLSLMTCDADLVDYSNVEDSRVVVFTLNERDVNVEVSQHARMRVWLSSGILLNEKYLQEGVNSMSLMQGIYILEFIFEDNSREIRQIVVN